MAGSIISLILPGANLVGKIIIIHLRVFDVVLTSTIRKTNLLRTVPLFVSAHTLCASRDGPRRRCLLIQKYFAPFMIMREKQILAMVVGIQTLGLTTIFLQTVELQF